MKGWKEAVPKKPPVMRPAVIVLSHQSRFRRSAHESMTGEVVCHCEWRTHGLFFRTRRGELFTPLSEISAFWRRSGWLWTLSGKLPVYEVQIKNQELPEWRFLFESALEHVLVTTAVQDLRRAIAAANPAASIVPPPSERGLFVRLILDFFS